MTNKVLCILFFSSVVIFIVSIIATKKTHVGSVIKDYFSVYLGGKQGNTRRISFSSLFALGILPYVIGISGTLLFRNKLVGSDLSFLISFDGMMISILSVFFGFGVFTGKGKALKYTTSILFVSIFLLLSDALILWSTSFVSNCSCLATFLWCAYYGIKVKVLVLFFVSLHNIYYLNEANNDGNSSNESNNEK